MGFIFVVFFIIFIFLMIVRRIKQQEKAIQVWLVQEFIQLSNDDCYPNHREESTIIEKLNDLFDGNKSDVDGSEDIDDIDDGGD